jgi:hypothetical protein
MPAGSRRSTLANRPAHLNKGDSHEVHLTRRDLVRDITRRLAEQHHEMPGVHRRDEPSLLTKRPPLYGEGLNTRRADGWTHEALWPSAIPGEWMEHLWSPAGATGGNRWQMGRGRKPLKQADRQPVAPTATVSQRMVKRTFATGCHRLRTIPYLLERESTSRLRKEIESREPEGPQDSARTLTATACQRSEAC